MADEVDNTLAREEDASPAPDVADEASAEVDATAPAEPLPEVDATAPAEPLPEATKPMPEAVEVPDYDDAAEPAPTPQLADIGADLASWAKGRAAKAGAFLSAHRLLVVLVALVCVGAILAAVLFGINSSQTPPDSLITADVRERLTAPSHTANAYEVDEPLVLQSVDVGSKRPSGTRRDGCEVNAEVIFANSGMETRAEAQLTYVRKGDTWTCTAASTSDASP